MWWLLVCCLGLLVVLLVFVDFGLLNCLPIISDLIDFVFDCFELVWFDLCVYDLFVACWHFVCGFACYIGCLLV